jgi:hypothetical protein
VYATKFQSEVVGTVRDGIFLYVKASVVDGVVVGYLVGPIYVGYFTIKPIYVACLKRLKETVGIIVWILSIF